MISGLDLRSLLPAEIIAGGILLNMTLITILRKHVLIFISSLVVLISSAISIFYISSIAPHSIGEIFLADRFGFYFQVLIILAAIVINVFSYIHIEKTFPGKRKEEYYLLMMLATLGACMMVISTHFISFFVSLEILNISLYSLISYFRERTKAIEAGLKYLILAAMSSAFILFGMALVYATTGTMAFHELAGSISSLSTSSTLMFLSGIGLMIAGIGFKLAFVPFHMWTPDVYEGASSPVTAFIATVSKGAMAAVLLRFFVMVDLYRFKNVMLVFMVVAILSMLIGNLLAIRQNNVKRLLAYSSIAHFGYLLIALTAGIQIGPAAAAFYITAYIITILGAFGIITLMSGTDSEATNIEEYAGLFWKSPLLATLFTIILLSLAGIPLTAGFMGKYFLLTAGVSKGNWLLVYALVTGSVIGLYYYLRIIVVMMKRNNEMVPNAKFPIRSSISGIMVLITLSGLVFYIGFNPAWLINLVKSIL